MGRAGLSTKLVILAATVWVTAIVGGFGFLWIYKSKPGLVQQQAPPTWPRDSRLARSADRATLVMFAHPRCPCTRASIHELAQLMARLHDQLEAFVLFLAPSGRTANWDQTDLWSSAAQIPGVTALRDDDGVEASHFGAATSGHVVLYDAKGRLLFSGGITSARGHEGDSFGRQRILALLTTGTADRSDAPVFGCALHEEQAV